MTGEFCWQVGHVYPALRAQRATGRLVDETKLASFFKLNFFNLFILILNFHSRNETGKIFKITTTRYLTHLYDNNCLSFAWWASHAEKFLEMRPFGRTHCSLLSLIVINVVMIPEWLFFTAKDHYAIFLEMNGSKFDLRRNFQWLIRFVG